MREIDTELQSLDNGVTGYIRELYSLEQTGKYNGFSPYAWRFCVLLCGRDYLGTGPIKKVAYRMTFPNPDHHSSAPETDEDWRKNKAFKEFVPELQSLAGMDSLVIIENFHTYWSIIRMCLNPRDVFIEESIRFALSPQRLIGLQTYLTQWTFFKTTDPMVAKISPLGTRNLSYQEWAVLGLLQYTYQFGRRTTEAINVK